MIATQNEEVDRRFEIGATGFVELALGSASTSPLYIPLVRRSRESLHATWLA